MNGNPDKIIGLDVKIMIKQRDKIFNSISARNSKLKVETWHSGIE